jgi:outer membrane protein OmpA-like peptidoglycan-associated protein
VEHDAAMGMRRIIVGGLILSLGASGCTALREHPTACRVTGAAIGAVIGGVGTGLAVGQIDTDGNNHAAATGLSAAAGAAVGALAGLLVSKYTCEVEPPASPPPVPAPPPPPPTAGTKILTLEATQFAFDRYDLTAEGETKVNDAVKIMRESPSIRVAVDGYTDSIGSDAYNLRLSERRAGTVRDYLVAHGIDAGRITARGFGKNRPVASNATEEGRAQNRRVDIVVQ